MAKVDYEVVVVGGGPAGAAAAKAASEAGMRTLLVEKKKMPRHKPCSGYVFTEAQEFIHRHYGPLPGEVMAEPPVIERERLHFGGDRYVDVRVLGWNVWRSKFDQWLCDRSGAEIWEGTKLVDFASWKDRVDVVLERGGEEIKLKAGILIAADGGLSRVVERIDPTFSEGVPQIVTCHEYHRCRVELEPGVFHVFLDADYGVYPAVYGKDDLVVVDTSVRRGRRLKPVREAFHAMLSRKYGFRPGEPYMRMGCRTIFPAAVNRFCLGTDRVLLAGEAAGFMNTLGEGISSALATGYLAGLAARGEGGGSPGEVYRQSVKAERERTAREWSLPALLMGRARPEFRQALRGVSPGDLLRLLHAILSWQRRGGVAPGLQREYLETALRRMLHGDYHFRA